VTLLRRRCTLRQPVHFIERLREKSLQTGNTDEVVYWSSKHETMPLPGPIERGQGRLIRLRHQTLRKHRNAFLSLNDPDTLYSLCALDDLMFPIVIDEQFAKCYNRTLFPASTNK